MWGEWIEIMAKKAGYAKESGSLPVWGEWIEMLVNQPIFMPVKVSPRVGRVD